MVEKNFKLNKWEVKWKQPQIAQITRILLLDFSSKAAKEWNDHELNELHEFFSTTDCIDYSDSFIGFQLQSG